jgi:hypothetical protein
MAKRGTRRVSRKSMSKSKGIFSRVYSPLYHLLEATRNVGKSVFKRSGHVVDETLGLGQDVGKAIAKHANMTVRDVISRKNRRNTRRNSRSKSRSNRR